ncbi:MAG TPA: hypothetical protein VEK06_01200 [Myxococcota bacterium]|nr:hypothetical protein [Myxococcota bacterium]
MKKTLVTSLFLIIASAAQAEFSIKALHCGPRGSFFTALLSDLAIPDFFPPEQFLVRTLIAEPILGDLSVCDEYQAVNLGESCQEHDTCYMTLGANKDSCDETLLSGWKQSCRERYVGSSANSLFCLDACEQTIELMYGGLRYDDGSFCPSCTAFENSQASARRRISLD